MDISAVVESKTGRAKVLVFAADGLKDEQSLSLFLEALMQKYTEIVVRRSGIEVGSFLAAQPSTRNT